MKAEDQQKKVTERKNNGQKWQLVHTHHHQHKCGAEKRRTLDGRFCRLAKCYLLSLIHLYSFRMASFLNARLSFVIDKRNR